MPIIEFPYIIYKEHRLPMVPVRIKSDDKWHEIWMFVDSGATYTILNARESKRLDIDHKTGDKIFVKVGDDWDTNIVKQFEKEIFRRLAYNELENNYKMWQTGKRKILIPPPDIFFVKWF